MTRRERYGSSPVAACRAKALALARLAGTFKVSTGEEETSAARWKRRIGRHAKENQKTEKREAAGEKQGFIRCLSLLTQAILRFKPPQLPPSADDHES